MSTSWTKNIFLYYDGDEAWDGMCDHIKKNEAKENPSAIVQSRKPSPRSPKEPNAL